MLDLSDSEMGGSRRNYRRGSEDIASYVGREIKGKKVKGSPPTAGQGLLQPAGRCASASIRTSRHGVDPK